MTLNHHYQIDRCSILFHVFFLSNPCYPMLSHVQLRKKQQISEVKDDRSQTPEDLLKVFRITVIFTRYIGTKQFLHGSSRGEDDVKSGNT